MLGVNGLGKGLFIKTRQNRGEQISQELGYRRLGKISCINMRHGKISILAATGRYGVPCRPGGTYSATRLPRKTRIVEVLRGQGTGIRSMKKVKTNKSFHP